MNGKSDRDSESYPSPYYVYYGTFLGVFLEVAISGIVAILDHHALPGVQTPNASFAGRSEFGVTLV